ncbi:MAG: Gfo/Idh/MocA family protein, partial [Planctomycetota bacterium]
MTRPLGWGIVGCGDVVEKKSGPSIARADRSRIVAVMRRDADKARPFAEANGVELCTDDAAAVIGHPDVDIVYVATPPASHQAYVLAAARAGKPVLVEKPMGLTAADSRAMIDACDAADVELFVAYYRRFQPHAMKMTELIESGRLGTPVAAQIDFALAAPPTYEWGWRIEPSISGGGLFVDVVSHRIDLMIRLLGSPDVVRGLTATFGTTAAVEDVVAATIRFANGVVCSVQGDFASTRTADRFVIAGTHGT